MKQKIGFVTFFLGIVFSAILNLSCSHLAIATVAPSITETRITDVDSYSPKIYENKVVWEDYRNGHADVYMADVTDPDNIVETRVTTESHDHSASAIYGNKVVWQDYRNGNNDIYMADVTDPDNIVETPIITNASSQMGPEIYNNTVVWEDYRNGSHGDIYMADISDPNNIVEKRVATNQSSYTHPAIHGDKVVWEDVRNGNRDIYMADISDPDNVVETRITTNSSAQYYPSIYGNKIVWQDARNGDMDIYIANIADLDHVVESRITLSASSRYAPVIYGNKILWEEDDGDGEIYMADFTDLDNIVETHITSDDYVQFSLSIYDNKIVWTDYRNEAVDGMANIYMATLIEPFNNFASNEKFEQDIETGFISFVGSDSTSVSEVTFENEYTIITYDAQVVIPEETKMTKTGGGSFDLTQMTMEDIAESLRNSYVANIAGAVGIGIPNSGLTFSKNISVTISVGGSYDGQTLNVYYQNTGENDWNLAATCEVSSGLCQFQTNHATKYSAGDKPAETSDDADVNDDNNGDQSQYAPKVIVGKSSRNLSSSGTNLLKSQTFTFRGSVPNLKKGDIVQIWKNEKLIKNVVLKKGGKWRYKVRQRRNTNSVYQFRYLDSRTKEEIAITSEYTIFVDRTKPKFTDFPNSQTVSPGDSITWAATDNDQIDYCQVIFQKKKTSASEASFQIPQNAKKGISRLQVTAFDRAGNKTAEKTNIRVR